MFDRLDGQGVITHRGGINGFGGEFANGAAVYTILLSPDGKIAMMNYRPVPTGSN